jgi:predicted CXXCH cytochrome family protein
MLVLTAAFLYLTAGAQTTGSRGNGYVEPALCASCHPKQAATYRLTGMGRSFFQPNPSNRIEDFSRALPYYHEPSATYYNMVVRDGRYYQSQYQIGFDGKPTNVVEKAVDYVVGSGNHARTYLSRTTRNTLIEMPLAWYAEKGGYWAMNPGYDRPDHDDLTRHIDYNCLFCHNAYPDMPAGPKTSGGESVFPRTLPEGIDCQRCHGPGSSHVEAARNRTNPRTVIVNPARLTSARAIEICLQCHLETTSFPLPNSIVRFDRGPFSYRPGEPLANVRLDFDRAPGSSQDTGIEIASSAWRLEKSACRLKDGDKLACTTCHDPHDVRHGAEADRLYNAVCQGCHRASLDKRVALDKRIGLSRHTTSADCIGCHMPKRRTDDVVHVVMTDHWIQRFKPAGDLLATIPERPHEYRGEVVPYRPGPKTEPGQRADDELYLAEAQVIQRSNLDAGIPRLQTAIRKFQPRNANHYAALADALRFSGQCERAIPVYEEALRHDPGEIQIIQKMALCLASAGNHAKVEKALGDALEKAPDDPQLWTQLGLALVEQGRRGEAVAALSKAIGLDPDFFEAWNDLGEVRVQNRDAAGAEEALRNALRAKSNSAAGHSNLATLLSATNRFEEAKYHFEAALCYRPDDASIHLSYGRALARMRLFPEARVELETSLQGEPDNADSHHALGLVLDAQGDAARAIGEYRVAVKLRPGYSLANLSLGYALLKSGKPEEARPYLQAAGESTDVPVREQAQRLLKGIP